MFFSLAGLGWWPVVWAQDKGSLPDLIGEDETGGVIDELALLQEEIAEDEVESASKHRQSIFWSPSAITVLTRDDIRSSGASSLPDLLRRVPGFGVVSIKPSYSLVGARTMVGVGNNLLLLLVDGREDLLELTGFALWNFLSFDLQQVERIEVIRGPGSALYGANAFAGVVSVTTVPDQVVSGVDFNLLGGEQGHLSAFGRARGAMEVAGGSLSYNLSLSALQDLSPSEPSDELLKGWRSHNTVRYRRGRDLDLSLHGGVEIGQDTIYLFLGDMRGTDLTNPWILGQAEIGVSEALRLKTQLYFKRYEFILRARASLRGYGMWIADIPEFYWASDTVDGQVQLDLDVTDSLLVVAGANLRYSTVDSTHLIVNDSDELRGAGFLNLQWAPWEILQLTAGLRVDANEYTGTVLSPRAVAVLRPWPDQSFRLGYSLAFKKPSFFESRIHVAIDEFNPVMADIVDKMTTSIGNEQLQNMKVSSVEAGWQGLFFGERLRTTLDLYVNLYRDTIEFWTELAWRMGVPDIANSTIQFENDSSGTNEFGGELEAIWKADSGWQLWGNLSVGYWRWMGSTESTWKHSYSVNLGGRYLPPQGWVLDLAIHYSPEFLDSVPDPDAILTNNLYRRLGDDWLLFGRIGYRLPSSTGPNLELGLAIRTPLGADFRENAGIPVTNLDTRADFGGELIRRQISAYLRGAF